MAGSLLEWPSAPTDEPTTLTSSKYQKSTDPKINRPKKSRKNQTSKKNLSEKKKIRKIKPKKTKHPTHPKKKQNSEKSSQKMPQKMENQAEKKKGKPRKLKKKTETKTWTLFLKEQSGAPPHHLLNFLDRGTCLCAITGTSTTLLLKWICGTFTTFYIGLCYSVSRPGLSLNEDTDSGKPPTSSELTGWMVLCVAT